MLSDFPRDRYPELFELIENISAQNPLQRKSIEAFIDKQDVDYWEHAGQMACELCRGFLSSPTARLEAARAYNRTCLDLLREQIQFRKTGAYRVGNATLAHDQVYAQADVMRYYLIGLLLSYLFWPNHYAMWRFFCEHLQANRVHRYLDVAPGHGLFVIETLRRVAPHKGVLVDISETALEMTRDILDGFQVDTDQLQFIQGDFISISLEDQASFDLIVMGEVLEHVNRAPDLLGRAASLLDFDGTLFLTTCANCPAIDHVYHFHNVDEIRALIRDTGLDILRELVLPADDVPPSRWNAELTTINYAAFLTKPQVKD